MILGSYSERKEEMSILGLRIKQLRNEKKISQTVLGEHCGTDKTTVSRWESGQYTPDPETIAKIATFFQITTDYLLGKTFDSSSPKLDLKEIKKALLEKELIYNGYELTKDEQEGIKSVLLAVIEREEKKALS
jgi:transcriptional regulator with XRE-family HTH domain